MNGDNFRIDVTSDGRDNLLFVLAICAHRTVTARLENNRLVLYWSPVDTAPGLIAPMGLAQTADFVVNWLARTAEYGPEPEYNDGTNEKGWHAYNEEWGHIDNEWAAFLAIEPVWIMYGR